MSQALFTTARKAFHQSLFNNDLLTADDSGVPSNADRDNKDSIQIATELLGSLGKPKVRAKVAAQTAGSLFEKQCLEFVKSTFLKLGHLRPGKWVVTHPGGRQKHGLVNTEQYAHLAMLEEACDQQPALAAILGQDYLIKPDILILRETEEDASINAAGALVDDGTARGASLRKANGGQALFHASISCKFTMRSDRSQNSRAEALNLIRNRKGRTPHIVVVTAEPLPSRLASLALGTGDLDYVYHIALPELQHAVKKCGSADSNELLKTMVDGKRLRDISDLPLDLAV